MEQVLRTSLYNTPDVWLALSFRVHSLPRWNLRPKTGCPHRTFPLPPPGLVLGQYH